MKLTPNAAHPDAVDPSDVIIDMPSPLSVDAVASKPTVAWTENASLYGLLVTLMWAPLAFGSTEPWSQFILRTLALALFALWIARQHAQDSVQLFPDAISRPILAFIALVLFQLISGSTAYRYATLTESLHLLVYGIFVLVAGDLFSRRHRLRIFVISMAVFGFGLAVFSIIQGLTGTDRIYWIRTVDAISASIYGPYANHNHYAGLMEMLIPLTVAAAFTQRGAKQVLLLFATAIMALSVALSRSRGGMVALAAELLFVSFLLFRSQRGRRGLLVCLGIFGAIAAFVFVLGSDKILERFSETQDAYRLKIYRDSLSMAAQKPIIGYGLGTFSDVYPAHKSFYTNLFVNHAHNDYLETLVDTGIVGLGLFAWMLFGVFRSGLSKVMDRDDHEGRMLTAAALTGIIGILAHGLLDFNLRIPANASLFFVLCAAVATPFKHKIKPAEFRPWPVGDDDELEGESLL